jgi:hypothetical protein
MATRRPKSQRAIQRALSVAAADLNALRKPKTPIELAQRLYERSPLPVRRIAEIVGIHTASLYRIARREGWKPRKFEILHCNDIRFARRFHLGAAGAGKKGLSKAEIARAFATRTPEELAAQREAICAELWDKTQAEILKINARSKRVQDRRERREELGEMLLMSQTVQSLLRLRKQLQGAETPEAASSREEIGASILTLLDEMQSDGEKNEVSLPKKAAPTP